MGIVQPQRQSGSRKKRPVTMNGGKRGRSSNRGGKETPVTRTQAPGLRVTLTLTPIRAQVATPATALAAMTPDVEAVAKETRKRYRLRRKSPAKRRATSAGAASRIQNGTRSLAPLGPLPNGRAHPAGRLRRRLLTGNQVRQARQNRNRAMPNGANQAHRAVVQKT